MKFRSDFFQFYYDKMRGLFVFANSINTTVICCKIYCNLLVENLALKKPTWQKHPYLEKPWGSNLAVDGQYSNLSQYGGQCAISLNRETAEWRVDLGDMYSIYHIRLHYAQGMEPWGKVISFPKIASYQNSWC